MNNTIKELEKRLQNQKYNVPTEVQNRAIEAQKIATQKGIVPTPQNIFKIMQMLKRGAK